MDSAAFFEWIQAVNHPTYVKLLLEYSKFKSSGQSTQDEALFDLQLKSILPEPDYAKVSQFLLENHSTLSVEDIKKRGVVAASSEEKAVPGDCVTYNLYVSDLNEYVQPDDLKTVFSNCGAIHSVFIHQKPDTGRRYAFVNFFAESARDIALANYNNVSIKGSAIRCFKSDSKASLYIGNLNTSLPESQLRQLIEAIGGPMTTFSVKQGFAFANYSSLRQADYALKALNGAEIGGQPLRVQVALSHEKKSSSSDSQPRTLFIKNIAPTINEDNIRQNFAPFGQIISIRLVRDAIGVSKGFAFIQYLDYTQSAAALSAMNGQIMDGKPLKIEFSRTNSGDKHKPDSMESAPPPHPPSLPIAKTQAAFEAAAAAGLAVTLDPKTGQDYGQVKHRSQRGSSYHRPY